MKIPQLMDVKSVNFKIVLTCSYAFTPGAKATHRALLCTPAADSVKLRLRTLPRWRWASLLVVI